MVREVVIEAVINHRPNRDLSVWKQLLHCIGEQMRR